MDMDPRMRRNLAVLCVLAAATIAYPLVPLSGDTWRVYYNAVALSAVLIALSGVVFHRTPQRRAWLSVIGGFCAWVLADLVATLEQQVWHLPYYPVPSDAVYLVGYVLVAAGALRLVRTRDEDRDLTVLLDAAIVATGAAVVAAVFLIAPLATDSTLTGFGKVVSSAYPVADILLIAVIFRLWAAPVARTASSRLLMCAVTLSLAGDVVWNVLIVTDGSQADRWSDQLYLATYVLFAAATWAPSMARLGAVAPEQAGAGSLHRRVVVLAGGLMLPSVTLLISGATGRAVLWQVIGLGSLLISGLVLVRMSGILRTVESQSRRLADLARLDELTGIPNRRTWDHELDRVCAESRLQGAPLCVAIIDLDHFKVYNDAFGHQAGDRLLRDSVAAWAEHLGDRTFLARYGGDEFTVLLPGLDLDDARARLQGLRGVTPHGQTISAGVARWDPQAEPASAVAGADVALYAAKEAGRDRVLTQVVVTADAGGVGLLGLPQA
ncbi:GGDEF domain-containing protein [Pengzhenrongella frigida]|uniref:GGDEF domain-containing protein n=1 Tax=Pengzhenrongella frigida TaxID=1259133 RepID=A0A4Q5MZE4_9MICO|nr:GGDEF domain-containing protein [Cellulomonas sp. HLT2-17]RYV51128.1 GGDEF domain-containing protein [Cellulomonas sp. HLT2-17]